MTQSPPGWYQHPAPPEPGAPPLLRFWDGRQWSWQVAPLPGPTTLDGLWAAGDRKRQALHDKAGRTNVVRTR